MTTTTILKFRREFDALQKYARREPVEIARHGRRVLVVTDKILPFRAAREPSASSAKCGEVVKANVLSDCRSCEKSRSNLGQMVVCSNHCIVRFAPLAAARRQPASKRNGQSRK
jgi:hypothetical protein